MGGSALFTASVAVFSYALATLLLSLGLNKRVYNHVPGECSSVGSFEDGVNSFETAFDGTLFIAAGGCLENCSTSEFNGRLLTYNVDNKSAWQLTVTGSKVRMNPGGLSVVPSKNKIHLMMLNHWKKTTVEVFAYKDEKSQMKHLKTVKSKKFQNLVDIAAVDREKFYATSFNYFNGSWWKMAEVLGGLSTGSILFFDGKQTIKVASLPSPTGIVYDRFRRLIFVASLAKEAVIVYDIAEDYSLTPTMEVPLQCAPQSLWRDIDNSLLTACHPVKLRYLTYQLDRSLYYSPTQILRIHYRSNTTMESPISQMYSNDGATVSAAGAAVRAGKTLLIGASSGMLSCDLPMS